MFSVQQIWEALDIVDTEDYRQVIEGLQRKGLITGLGRNRIRGIGGEARKLVPRWRIRDAREANELLGELIRLTAEETAGQITPAALRRVDQRLGTSHPFRSNALSASLAKLGLVDDQNEPSGELAAAIQKPSVAEAATPAPRGQRAAGTVARDEPPSDVVELADRPTKIYVGNLEYHVRPNELRAVFEEIGPVASVSVPRDFQRGLSRGYGFVEMQSREDAKRAQSELDGREIRGRRIRLDWAQSSFVRIDSRTS